MTYKNTARAVFCDRPNRFIAHCEMGGETLVCHVKNTGRCRELLVPGATVILQHSDAPGRRTEWDLISVYKGERLINMDAAAPNAAAGEWLRSGGLGFVPELLRPEWRHGDSRFDFYFTHGGKEYLMEVKGVTLEENGIVRFPDAPTERGVKHLQGLAAAVSQGYGCAVLFVVQMENVKYFEPNAATHPEFAAALREAQAAGVRVLAMDCRVGEDFMEIGKSVEVRL